MRLQPSRVKSEQMLKTAKILLKTDIMMIESLQDRIEHHISVGEFHDAEIAAAKMKQRVQRIIERGCTSIGDYWESRRHKLPTHLTKQAL